MLSGVADKVSEICPHSVRALMESTWKQLALARLEIDRNGWCETHTMNSAHKAIKIVEAINAQPGLVEDVISALDRLLTGVRTASQCNPCCATQVAFCS